MCIQRLKNSGKRNALSRTRSATIKQNKYRLQDVLQDMTRGGITMGSRVVIQGKINSFREGFMNYMVMQILCGFRKGNAASTTTVLVESSEHDVKTMLQAAQRSLDMVQGLVCSDLQTSVNAKRLKRHAQNHNYKTMITSGPFHTDTYTEKITLRTFDKTTVFETHLLGRNQMPDQVCAEANAEADYVFETHVLNGVPFVQPIKINRAIVRAEPVALKKVADYYRL